MIPDRKKATVFLLVVAAVFGVVPATGQVQTGGIGINPGRLEVEIHPGQEKTVAFQLESPPSDRSIRGRLLLSVTDWNINEDATVTYYEPGMQPNSASAWIVFSPSAVSISSGQTQLVRVTAKVPAGTRPGVYRTAIFVQERPPATPPERGQHVVYFRFRYAFTLYVIVPPVSGRGEFVDVRMDADSKGFRLICEMKNMGSRHVRPYVSWVIRNSDQAEIAAVKNYEATVLLPFSTVKEPFIVEESLPPGKYEIDAQVDFHDGGPVQAIKRTIEISPSAASIRFKCPLPEGEDSCLHLTA